MLTQCDRESKKHELLAAQWRREIERGVWQPGDRLPPFTELCRLRKVSRTTVERACRALESDGLIARRHGSGTYVEPRPRRLLHNMVGFTGYGFARRPRLRYWTLLQEGIEEIAAREGKGVVLLDQNSPAGWDRLDGILFSDVTEENFEQCFNFAAPDLPRVSLLFSIPGCDCVVADEYEGGRMATRHLLDLGHRRIAYLSSPQSPLVRRRLAGYHDALLQAGITPDPRWQRLYGEQGRVFPNFIERSTEVMRAWIADDWHSLGCTAILATNDQVAAGILIALHEARVEVPNQVSIVGYDNSEICDYLTPRLTSVHVPLHRVGFLGMEKLLQQIDSESRRPPVTTMLPVELIVRGSTTTAAG